MSLDVEGGSRPDDADSDSAVIGTGGDNAASSSTGGGGGSGNDRLTILVLLLMSPLMLYYLALVIASFVAVTVIDSEGLPHAVVLRSTANFQVRSQSHLSAGVGAALSTSVCLLAQSAGCIP